MFPILLVLRAREYLPFDRNFSLTICLSPICEGYVRVILAIVAFYYIRQPELFLPLYGVSCLLDVADGYAARWLGQCSRFGSVLDMVTDRCSTAGLLCHLCSVYPQWTLAFQLLVALDLSSHYMHMYRYNGRATALSFPSVVAPLTEHYIIVLP